MVNELLIPRQKRLEILFYFMIACALLGPTLGIPVTDGFTLTFFRIAFALLAGGIIIRYALKKSLQASYMYPVRWYAAFFLFWLVYASLSLSWVVSLSAGIRYLIFLGMMLPLTLSFPFFLHKEKNFWKTKRILFWTVASIVYFGVFESITVIHLPPSRAFGTDEPTVTSFFTNQNDLATCITLAIPFIITSLFMLNLNRKQKIVVYLTGVLSIYVLLATGSRSNTVFALPLALFVTAATVPLAVDRKMFTKKNIVKAIVAVLVGAFIVTGMSNTFLSEENREKTRTKIKGTVGFFSDLQYGSWDVNEGSDKMIRGDTGESATVRKYLMLNGLNFLKDSHYLGVGAGNIEPLMENAPKVNKVNMHNWWLEILVNFGVLIFVLYMVLYVWMLWRLLQLARRNISPQISPLVRWGAVSSLASLTGFIFGGVAPSTAIHYTPMWICYGIGLAVIMLGENQKKHNKLLREDIKQAV